jgi:hypothetical protein
VKPFSTFLVALLLWLVALPTQADMVAFNDPDDIIRPGDLRRVVLDHEGNLYKFKATMWDDFANRTMKPGSGVQWDLDVLAASPGGDPYDFHVDLEWKMHNGERRYRCTVRDRHPLHVVDSYPGRRDGKTVICPNIRKGNWGGNRVTEWDVLSFYNEDGHVGLDGSGPHPH